MVSAMSGDWKAQMRAVLKSAVDARQVSGACVYVAQHGREIAYLDAGFSDLEAGVAMRRDAIFRLYSMTKPVTAVAAMILIERGQLSMQSPVADYLPAFRGMRTRRPITVADLMRMTSGLTYGGEDSETERQTKALLDRAEQSLLRERPMTTLEFAEQAGGIDPLFEPGTAWKYGVSADVMGAVIEVASGKPFGAFLRDEIFAPLGMKDTGFCVPREQRHRLAKVYENGAQGGLVEYTGSHLGIRNRMDREAAFESGGAGLVSTVDDFARFAQMLLNMGTLDGAQILRPRTVEYLTTGRLLPHQQRHFDEWFGMDGFSYANFLRVLHNPGQALSVGRAMEYCWDGWLGCYFVNCPQQRLTFIVMQQRKDGSDLIPRLRNVLFTQDFDAWTEVLRNDARTANP